MAPFDGDRISGHGGALLRAEVERPMRFVLRRAQACIDRRDVAGIRHDVRELAMLSVLGLC